MHRPFNIQTALLLLGIFVVSVAVRVPNLGRPLSKHHEFTTAVALQVMQSWHENGIRSVGFNPSMNYGRPADKFINEWANPTGELVDEQGNFYYVSHPPLAYYIPYAIFQAVGARPNVLGLQVIHVGFHFLSGLLVYFIICLLAWVKPLGTVYVSGLVGYCIYIFNPATLWFQSNTYMADMLVMVPFIAGVFVVLKLLMRRRFYSPKYLIFYAAVLFLMVYTSWLGVFFAAAVLMYSLIKLRSERVFALFVTLTVLMPALALGLMVWQYAQIAGPEAYLDQMLQRYAVRGSGHGAGVAGFLWTTLRQLAKLIGYYGLHNLPTFILLGSLTYFVLTRARLRIVFTHNGYRFLWLSVLPVVLLHLILLNYSGHDFTVLYGALFLAVLVGILYDKLKYAATLNPYMLNAGVVLACLLSVGLYYMVNRPGETSWRGDRYAVHQELGEAVAAEAADDEVVFMQGLRPEPQTSVYAGRNIRWVGTVDEAMVLLGEHPVDKGIVFTVDDQGTVTEVRRVAVEVP